MAKLNTTVTRKGNVIKGHTTVDWRTSKGKNKVRTKEEVEREMKKVKTKEARERAMMKLRERRHMKSNSNLLTKYSM